MENSFRAAAWARPPYLPTPPTAGRAGPARRDSVWISALVFAALPAFTAPASARPALVTVGQGSAWVREFFPSSGESDIQRIDWTGAPPELDLDTLQVWGVRRPWPIRSWDWVPAPAAESPADGQPVVWRPGAAPRPPAVRNQLAIHLDLPLPHRMGHSLTYRLPGMDWQTLYRVVVRGIGPQSIESVQVDLTATVRIRNDTSAAFPDARLSLVGVDRLLAPPAKPFGRLDLNPDTPLSDLWLSLRDPLPLLPHHYPLETPASLPAQDRTDIQFARIDRKPARISHVCDSDEIPAPTQSGGLPLTRVLLIPNTPAMGLGFPLPPGEADLFLGAVRGAPVQTGHVFHTPYPGTLQIGMGPADAVRASRLAGAEVPLPEGAWQVDHTVTLVNQLETPVQVQVVERPSTPMEWNLVRSSVPGTVTSDALRFELTLPPNATQTLTYRLRLTARSM